jgi:hypothetical protein
MGEEKELQLSLPGVLARRAFRGEKIIAAWS